MIQQVDIFFNYASDFSRLNIAHPSSTKAYLKEISIYN